jgi:hypothetical protein
MDYRFPVKGYLHRIIGQYFILHCRANSSLISKKYFCQLPVLSIHGSWLSFTP